MDRERQSPLDTTAPFRALPGVEGSEQGAAAASLGEIEQIYRVAPVGICLTDREMRFRSINARQAEVHGRTIEAHLGRTVGEILPEFSPTVEPYLRRVLESGNPILGIEVSGRLPGNSAVVQTWLVSHHPLPDEAGETQGVVTVSQEITHLKRADQHFLAQRDRLDEAQRISGQASWEWNLDSSELSWSQLMFSLYGQQPNRFEPSLENLFELLHPDDRALFRSHTESALKESGTHMQDYRILRHGEERTIRSIACRMQPNPGDPAYVIGTAQDFTEQTQRETDFAREQDRLRALLDERTAEVVWLRECLRVAGVPAGDAPSGWPRMSRDPHGG